MVFFQRKIYKLRLLENYLAQKSNLCTVGNNPVLAGRVIRWLMTIVLPISYFYHFHYDSSRGLCLCWQRSALTQAQHTWSKRLYLQVLFMNRRWQKKSEVKLLSPSWQAAGLGSDLQPGSFGLAPCLLCTVIQPWALLNCNHCSSCFLFVFRARGNLEHKPEKPADKISSIL